MSARGGRRLPGEVLAQAALDFRARLLPRQAGAICDAESRPAFAAVDLAARKAIGHYLGRSGQFTEDRGIACLSALALWTLPEHRWPPS